MLDSKGLMDHLAESGLAEFCDTLLRDQSLPAAAHPEAQPADVLEAWWHFFALLRGESELLADASAAEVAWRDAADPAVQARIWRRLVHIRAGIRAIRRGGWDDDATDQGASERSPGPGETAPI
jgi:DNA primase